MTAKSTNGNAFGNVINFTTNKAFSIYRSISGKEYRDIISSGILPGENSYSLGKLFVRNMADVKFYNKEFGNSIIAKIRVPIGVEIEKLLGVDGLEFIYNIPTEELSKLKILNYFK